MNKLNLTFGTDPELFLVESGTTNLVPPVTLRKEYGLEVIDNSDSKHPIFSKVNGVSVMEDGALFEFTVPPTKKSEQLFESVSQGKEELGRIGSLFGLEVLHSPIANFDVSRYFHNEELDEEQRLCVIAGCDSDEDAIDLDYESGVERNLTEWDKRGAGGHLHIGTKDLPELHKIIIPAVKLLATTVGVAVTFLATDTEAEKERMSVFGRPGRYRPQVYSNSLGVEYRTPSNSWLLSSIGVDLVFRAATRAMNLLAYPSEGKKQLDNYLLHSIEAIIQVNQSLAKELLENQDLI